MGFPQWFWGPPFQKPRVAGATYNVGNQHGNHGGILTNNRNMFPPSTWTCWITMNNLQIHNYQHVFRTENIWLLLLSPLANHHYKNSTNIHIKSSSQVFARLPSFAQMGLTENTILIPKQWFLYNVPSYSAIFRPYYWNHVETHSIG